MLAQGALRRAGAVATKSAAKLELPSEATEMEAHQVNTARVKISVSEFAKRRTVPGHNVRVGPHSTGAVRPARPAVSVPHLPAGAALNPRIGLPLPAG